MKILDLFDEINYNIFCNELDIPIFLTHYDDSYYGSFVLWEGLNIISLQADMDYKTGFCTLAHEMIHYWQNENNHKLNHGFKFRAMTKQIKNFYNLEKGAI